MFVPLLVQAVFGVAAWCPGGIHIFGWQELGYTVGGDPHVPGTVVDHHVVGVAQQHPVIDTGHPGVGEPVNMMRVDPFQAA